MRVLENWVPGDAAKPEGESEAVAEPHLTQEFLGRDTLWGNDSHMTSALGGRGADLLDEHDTGMPPVVTLTGTGLSVTVSREPYTG